MKLTLEILEERIKALIQAAKLKEDALKIQAKEYKRRLKDLNGEAGRLRGMQETYLLKDTYDTNIQTQSDKFQKAVEQLDLKFDQLIRELRKEIKDISDWKTAFSGGTVQRIELRNQFEKYIPWLIALAALAWGIFKPK